MQAFLKWLQFGLGIKTDRIGFRIYIHESKKNKSNEALEYWSKNVGFSKDMFSRTCFTRTVYPRKKKRDDKDSYHGQLRIKVRRSTDLNRKISGWIDGICLRCGVVEQNKV